MIGVVYKYNDELVFCPDLICDFHLGKPNAAGFAKKEEKFLTSKIFPI